MDDVFGQIVIAITDEDLLALKFVAIFSRRLGTAAHL